MIEFKFKKIDAFTDGTSSGNPAACVYLNSDIDKSVMQRIAKELKGFVNEVAFLIVKDKEISLRYFSSECEVDFCGHATIATMYDYIKNNEDLLSKPLINIKVKDSILNVYNNILKNNTILITSPNAIFSEMQLDVEKMTKALNINKEVISKKNQIKAVNAGLNTLIVPIESLYCLLNINPNQDDLKDHCKENNVDIVLVYSSEVANKANSYRTRVFAPKFGYLEDPATGSGNSAFGYYLLKHDLWDGNEIKIEQNSEYSSFNTVTLQVVLDGDERLVAFGGGAVVKADGSYNLY